MCPCYFPNNSLVFFLFLPFHCCCYTVLNGEKLYCSIVGLLLFYVLHVHSYQSTLKLLFQEFDEGDADARLTAVTTRIMQALQSNLDGKSKQYKDPALTQLFLMNNIHYIVRSVRRFVIYKSR